MLASHREEAGDAILVSILAPRRGNPNPPSFRTREEEAERVGALVGEPPEVIRWYSSDPGQEYRATLIAWSTSAILYESCGATCRLEHWEGGWVERPATRIRIETTYTVSIKDVPPMLVPGKTCEEANEQDMDCFYYFVGKDPRGLRIHRLYASASINVPNGEVARLGPVSVEHKDMEQ
ncbi:hypothetical protein [Geodermatophilus sp. SYSU D01186]